MTSTSLLTRNLVFPRCILYTTSLTSSRLHSFLVSNHFYWYISQPAYIQLILHLAQILVTASVTPLHLRSPFAIKGLHRGINDLRYSDDSLLFKCPSDDLDRDRSVFE